MTINIEKFINTELPVIQSTERDVFGLILRDCINGIDAIRLTNDNPVTENITKEEKVLKEIICQL